MNQNTIKFLVASTVATSAFVSVVPSQHIEASTNIEKLVTDAQKAGTVLKWAISIEGSADGKTQPWDQFNSAKSSILKAEAALSKVTHSDKLKYEALLIEPKTQLQRAQAYLDAITASNKIEEKQQLLSEAVASNNLELVEARYHEMTKEFRKQTILLDRVYGQSTRDRIRNVVKGPAEEIINYLKNDVTVYMYIKTANEHSQAGRYQEAEKKLNEAKTIMNSTVLVWGNLLKNSIDEALNAQPVQLVSISRVDNNTVTVKLNKEVSTVHPSEFAFDNSLSVTNASIGTDRTVVTITTSTQTPGLKYTMKFKNNSASFTVPGSVVPIPVGNQTVQHRETSEVLALTASFTDANGLPTKSNVRVDIPDGIKILTINGIENIINGAKNINVIPDKNGTVTIAFTAKDVNVPSVDKVLTFNKIDNNQVVETKASSKINFYAHAKAGTFNNKKVHYVDTVNNYFVTTDGLKYRVKTSGDTYKNEEIAISFDTFKGALGIEDTISGNYQPSESSLFNIVTNFYFVDLLLDTKFLYKPGTLGYRMVGNRVELNGSAQPNYDIHIFKNSTYVSKTRSDSKGAWRLYANVDQNAINDYALIQQSPEKQTPTSISTDAKSFRIIEGQFELSSVSPGIGTGEDLTNKEVAFLVAPVKNKDGHAIVQDQSVFLSNATITVQDADGTRVKYTNTQNGTSFNPVNNGFKITFGKIEEGKGNTILSHGRDGVLTGDLNVLSIEGVSNTYGLNLRVNNGFQIKGY